MTENTATESAEPTYSFEHRGETHHFEKSFAVVQTPKWLRQNRRRDEADLVFTIVEELGGEEVVELVDEMTIEEFRAFTKKLLKDMNATFRA
jgi:hypothetical protein